MLTLDQIKAAHGPKEFAVNVPEWGGEVRARRLTAQDYIALSQITGDSKDGDNSWLYDYMADVIARSLVKEDGSQLITEDDRYLLTDNPLLVMQLGQDLVDLNKMGRQKKSDLQNAPSNDSPSDSA